MKFAQAKQLAGVFAQANIPVFIWGAPGIGKSAMVHQMAGEASAMVIDIRLSMFDPVDLRGLPAIIDGATVWLKPAFWPSVAGKPAFLFFDEMDRASPAVKNAALQIVLDRRIGEHELPETVRIFAAGNGATDKGFAASMGNALNNRFAHIDMESDVDSWCKHADLQNWSPALVAFHQWRKSEPNIFHELNPSRDAKAYPSARAWERVNATLAICPAELRFHAVAGLVGDSVAGELVAFLDMFAKLPSLDSILANPERAPVFGHADLNVNYALACGLARAATSANFAAVMAYAQRMPREFEILCVTSATGRDSDLKNTRTYVDFAARNQGIFA